MAKQVENEFAPRIKFHRFITFCLPLLGSGKTYTMFGPSGIHNERKTQKDLELMGIIPRAVTEIFESIERKCVAIHYLLFFCTNI